MEKAWPRKQTYHRGHPILSGAELLVRIEAGGWFFFGPDGRPKHPSIIENMTLATLMEAISKGCLWKAERTDAE